MIDWTLIAILTLTLPILYLGCALVLHPLYGFFRSFFKEGTQSSGGVDSDARGGRLKERGL